MTRTFISSGSTFENEIGYVRAVVDGEWIFISGTTGFDYRTMSIADSVVEQARQSIENIRAAMGQAGFAGAWNGPGPEPFASALGRALDGAIATTDRAHVGRSPDDGEKAGMHDSGR